MANHSHFPIQREAKQPYQLPPIGIEFPHERVCGPDHNEIGNVGDGPRVPGRARARAQDFLHLAHGELDVVAVIEEHAVARLGTQLVYFPPHRYRIVGGDVHPAEISAALHVVVMTHVMEQRYVIPPRRPSRSIVDPARSIPIAVDVQPLGPGVCSCIFPSANVHGIVRSLPVTPRVRVGPDVLVRIVPNPLLQPKDVRSHEERAHVIVHLFPRQFGEYLRLARGGTRSDRPVVGDGSWRALDFFPEVPVEVDAGFVSAHYEYGGCTTGGAGAGADRVDILRAKCHGGIRPSKVIPIGVRASRPTGNGTPLHQPLGTLHYTGECERIIHIVVVLPGWANRLSRGIQYHHCLVRESRQHRRQDVIIQLSLEALIRIGHEQYDVVARIDGGGHPRRTRTRTRNGSDGIILAR
mmetsp:Transcript_10259/g.21643  ORF Transcript_10259/g.21643 Transcript_10259/m.21643 type:complete len:410 (+) Transcript_10259:268-1497(+)